MNIGGIVDSVVQSLNQEIDQRQVPKGPGSNPNSVPRLDVNFPPQVDIRLPFRPTTNLALQQILMQDQNRPALEALQEGRSIRLAFPGGNVTLERA